MSDRTHEIVLHGATGFVGRLVAEHLAEHAGGSRVALSGRSRDRLEAVRADLGVDWPLLVTDAADAASVGELARSTDVVATTVGPYGKHGLPLVRACAQAGVSYCDLTGETTFVRTSADVAHEQARASGARLVHSAGFDSIPYDLGVFLLHEQVRADGEGTLGTTVGVLTGVRGGLSGGTVDSMRTELSGGTPTDPYALSPDRAADPSGAGEQDPLLPVHDPLVGRWLAPSPFGPHDARIVRRTNALLGHAYGPEFRFREHLAAPLGPVGAGLAAAGLASFVLAMRLPPTRALLDRVLPDPGKGPSEQTRRSGHFRVEVHTRTTTGAHYVATVAAQGDPGYAATAVMFGETALCLAQDELDTPTGVLTPAAAVGARLADRLRARGMTLSVTRRA